MHDSALFDVCTSTDFHAGQLTAEVNELRGRNRALAEDLIHLTKSANGLDTQAPPGDATAAAAGGRATAGAAATSGPPSVGGAGDVESRVAAQLRASRAEMEVGTLR